MKLFRKREEEEEEGTHMSRTYNGSPPAHLLLVHHDGHKGERAPRWLAIGDMTDSGSLINLAELSGRLDCLYPVQKLALIYTVQFSNRHFDNDEIASFLQAGYQVLWDIRGDFDDRALFKSFEISEDPDTSKSIPHFASPISDATSEIIADIIVAGTVFNLSHGEFQVGDIIKQTSITKRHARLIDTITYGRLHVEEMEGIGFWDAMGYLEQALNIARLEHSGSAARRALSWHDRLMGCWNIWKRFVDARGEPLSKMLSSTDHLKALGDGAGIDSAISAYLDDGVPLEDILA